MKIYSILDRKAGTYGLPFYQHNDTTAMRTASMEVNRKEPGNVVAMYPEDFALYQLGTFDPETGVIDSQTPALLVNCDKLRKD